MDNEYTIEDLHDDMEFLREAGLIEIVGMTSEGKWLWAATEKASNMTSDEREQAIRDAADEFDSNQDD